MYLKLKSALKLPLFLALFLINACVSTQVRGPSQVSNDISASSDACATDPNYPRLFNVIENDSKTIVVEVGDFEKKFGIVKGGFFRKGGYTYEVKFQESRQKRTVEEIIPTTVIQSGSLNSGSTQIQVSVKATGLYTFVINGSGQVWKQKVFAVADRENKLSAEQEKILAEKFAPLVQYHPEEKYSPVSFSYLLNEVETDSDLQNEPFQLVGIKNSPEFAFKDLRKILPYNGHADSVLQSQLNNEFSTRLTRRFGENHKTVYYSVLEDNTYHQIYINYHFFYSFDPKNSKGENYVKASHIFDRESITVVLNSSGKPLSVFFGAHLPTQTMEYFPPESTNAEHKKINWQGGRVFVSWPDVNKNGNHPFAVAAQGSHGMYPLAGNYAVTMKDFPVLRETAGGGRIIYPETIETQPTKEDSKPYVLKSLNLKNLTSDCRNENNILAYSGSIVNVLGPGNATFPPFTDREINYFEYAYPDGHIFEMPSGLDSNF